ncbi:LuxR C-terminal-related transcriptional regulator [Actinophytocola sp.]|uniref:LuxR C-terminal-related transcriptional regulator n=1 Tax=Actinophytocola sp. TaxID=1872138 RepID=UPI00389A1170
MNSTASSRVRELITGLTSSHRELLTLRREIVAVLRRAVPFDGWCWGYTDPETRLFSSGDGDNPASASDLGRYFVLEFARDEQDCQVSFAELADGVRPAVSVLSDATGGDLHRNARWRELYGPHGVGDELRLALLADGQCWGYLELLREDTGRYFSLEEAEFLLRLGAPIAKAIRETLTRVEAPTTDLRRGPGTLVFDGNDVLAASTPEGDEWLATLRFAGTPAAAALPIPVPVVGLVGWLRSAGSPAPGLATGRVRTRTADGHWLVMHASPLTGMSVPVGSVAVTVQSARAGDVAGLIFRAHGLTARERQLAGLLLDGLSNTEIARGLDISAYTVQDHVKAVLGKLGVHSKRELIAGVLGQRL